MKINIISLGACTGVDILTTDSKHRDNYTLSNSSIWASSVGRSMVPSGKIAERLLSDLGDTSKLSLQARRQLNAITKFNNPVDILKNAPANSVIMVDLGYEITDYVIQGDEEFDMRPGWFDIKHLFPAWLDEVVSTGLTKFDSNSTWGTMHNYTERRRRLQQFFAILNKYKFPVIIIDNAWNPFTYNKEFNSITQTISVFNSRVPFLISDGSQNYIMLNYNYANKIINSVYETAKNTYQTVYKDNKHWVWFDLDRSMLYSDPEHPHGHHPCHLHYTCRKILNPSLLSLINKLYLTKEENETNQNF